MSENRFSYMGDKDCIWTGLDEIYGKNKGKQMNIIESIYNEPEKWRQSHHTMQHEDGAEVWTSNVPFFDTNTYPETSMSLYTKFKLWRAIRWWANNAPIEAFGRRGAK